MMQLTASTVFSVGNRTYSFFIAREGNHCGVVVAGSWDIVLPFRYERIEPLAEGGFVAYRRNRRMVFGLTADDSGCRLTPIRHAPHRTALPA